VRDTAGVTLVSGTITDVTSIVLTPGIWDVCGTVMFTGITTMTRQNGSIGETSATIPTISYGNNTMSATFTTTSPPPNGDDVGVTIPPFRVTVDAATTKTMYLIARANFTVSTAPVAYGRISATRVA
jgi:hypothetical protein